MGLYDIWPKKFELFPPKDFFGSNIIWPEKNVGPKNILNPKHIWSRRNFWDQKKVIIQFLFILVTKEIGDQNPRWLPKSFWIPRWLAKPLWMITGSYPELKFEILSRSDRYLLNSMVSGKEEQQEERKRKK